MVRSPSSDDDTATAEPAPSEDGEDQEDHSYAAIDQEDRPYAALSESDEKYAQELLGLHAGFREERRGLGLEDMGDIDEEEVRRHHLPYYRNLRNLGYHVPPHPSNVGSGLLEIQRVYNEEAKAAEPGMCDVYFKFCGDDTVAYLLKIMMEVRICDLGLIIDTSTMDWPSGPHSRVLMCTHEGVQLGPSVTFGSLPRVTQLSPILVESIIDPDSLRYKICTTWFRFQGSSRTFKQEYTFNTRVQELREDGE